MRSPHEAIVPIVDEEAINELTTRAIADIYPTPDALADELRSGRQLTAYMGIDPTAPDMHVGHASQLRKLGRLQNLGHNTILLIGDFTGRIGDPTDKSAARVKLTQEQVLENAAGYVEQASKILDFDREGNPTQVRYNSEWLGEMDFSDVLELAGEFTVQQMLERDMFRRRISDGKPVGLHEFMYPMMQGYDSVKLGVDIEIGGSDQIFNMLVGTELMRRHLKKQKYVIAGKLLADPSGRKIGKTEGNMITLNDVPSDMYHKIMRWSDEIAPHALELCSNISMSEINALSRRVESGEMTGLEAKEFLAKTIVTELHGVEAAESAVSAYKNLTAKDGEIDTSLIAAHSSNVGKSIVDVLTEAGLADSRSEARRLIEGGAVRINDATVGSEWTVDQDTDGAILQVGKKKRENFRHLSVEQ